MLFLDKICMSAAHKNRKSINKSTRLCLFSFCVQQNVKGEGSLHCGLSFVSHSDPRERLAYQSLKRSLCVRLSLPVVKEVFLFQTEPLIHMTGRGTSMASPPVPLPFVSWSLLIFCSMCLLFICGMNCLWCNIYARAVICSLIFISWSKKNI